MELLIFIGPSHLIKESRLALGLVPLLYVVFIESIQVSKLCILLGAAVLVSTVKPVSLFGRTVLHIQKFNFYYRL